VIVANAMGGVAVMLDTIAAYLSFHSRTDSLMFADSAHSWLRPISRLVLWNSMAVVGWAWAPILFYRRIASMRAPWAFLLIWLVPGIAFQLFVHIGEPGHTLFATPVLCLIGALVVFSIGRYRDALLAIAAMVSAGLFLNVIPLGYPASADAPAIERLWVAVRNTVAYGTFETSFERLHWTEELRTVSIEELWRFRAPDRPTTTVALNGNGSEFDFIDWRVVSYYLSDRPLWVLMDNLEADQPGRLRVVEGKDFQTQPHVTIPLPRGGRVLWIMQPEGRFHRALAKILPVKRGKHILYSDVPSDLAPFEIEGFHFRPEQAGIVNESVARLRGELAR
jgi:hypothetical protein